MAGDSGICLRSTPDFLDVCNRLLTRGDAVRFRAEGWSMYPTICDGDTVGVVPMNAADARTGHILLCRVGSRSVAHRVVGIAQHGEATPTIVLRGDASFSNDEPITAADILGMVTIVVRRGAERRLDTRTALLIGPLVARMWRVKRAGANVFRSA